MPLRRVNAAYVIATSTKVDVSKADLSSLADKNFTAEKKRKAKKSQEDFFGKDEPTKKVPGLAAAVQVWDAGVQDCTRLRASNSCTSYCCCCWSAGTAACWHAACAGTWPA